MDDEERQSQTPPQPRGPGRAVRTAGGALIGLGVLAAKFKVLLGALFAAKWLLLGAKLAWPLGTMFLSIWFYALAFGGWKVAFVFVMMILVHELGHFITWRNYGVRASLPMFIPGLGAFVSAPPTGTPAQNAAAALAGPAYGIAAAAVCWAYGVYGAPAAADAGASHHFWIACAYIGFFLNLFNLIPIPMLDGGAVAAAIDARLWIAGAVLVALWAIVFARSPFALVIVALIAFAAVPRIIALLRGQIDPHGSGLTTGQRVGTLTAYLLLIGIAVAGAAATTAAT